MKQTMFFICNINNEDGAFFLPLLKPNDIIISLTSLPPSIDLQIRRMKAQIVDIVGGFKDASTINEWAEELERDLQEILSSIISNKISCAIVVRNFDEQTFYSFYLISMISEVPALEIEKTTLFWIKESNNKTRLITYELGMSPEKAEIRGVSGDDLTKAYAILFLSSKFPTYPRLLAKSWCELGGVEAERRRVSKILNKLEEQGLVEKKVQYMDYFGDEKVRITSVPVHAYKTTIKGHVVIASIGNVEREEANILVERVIRVIEEQNLTPKDVWVEDIIPFCPVYNESLRGRFIISSNGHYAIPVKPEYLEPNWNNCAFIFIDADKQLFELNKKKTLNLLLKLGKIDVIDLQKIYRRRQEQGISGPWALPMSAKPWLDDPENGDQLKEYIDRLVYVQNPCPFLRNGKCLVQTPVSNWGFEPTKEDGKLYDLFQLKRKYNY